MKTQTAERRVEELKELLKRYDYLYIRNIADVIYIEDTRGGLGIIYSSIIEILNKYTKRKKLEFCFFSTAEDRNPIIAVMDK